MKANPVTVKGFFTLTPKTLRIEIAILILVSAILGALIASSGGSTSPAGLAQEQQVFPVATNGVAKLAPVAQPAPPPP